jgi:hypothetical protein
MLPASDAAIAGVGEILRKCGVCTKESSRCLVEGDAERLGIGNRRENVRVAAEVVNELLDLAGRRNRIAKILLELLPGCLELLPAFL